jgi:hypothetical protein
LTKLLKAFSLKVGGTLKHYLRELITLFIIAISCQTLSQETRKIVAVVDTGLPYNDSIIPYLCKGHQYDVTEKGIQDYHGHGTNILGLVARGINKNTHCLTMIKWWHNSDEPYSIIVSRTRIKAYSKLLIKLKPVLVNLSLSGWDYSKDELVMIKELLKNGAKVVVAAGNDREDLDASCGVYPACYDVKHKNYHIVGAIDTYHSNFKGPITDILPGLNQCGIFGLCMTGTSQAAGNLSAKLLRELN